MISSALSKARTAANIVTHLGPRWCAFRLQYAAKRRSGFFERNWPVREWADYPLDGFLSDSAAGKTPDDYLKYRSTAAPGFFFAATDREAYAPLLARFADAEVGSGPSEQVEKLREGELPYFSAFSARAGSPPAWHRNPLTGEETPRDMHWSRIGDFGSGDIKIIWEPSRFTFAYTMVRAYWRTGDETIPELFWSWLADWRESNAPEAGANWKCGQEASFRVMALAFALYGFLEAGATTPERIAQLAQIMAVSGERIEANVGYALSQKNNHGISEGVGLWTLGLLFPEFRKAARWRQLGRQVLEEQGGELIYDDGSFAQHSVNYHRLMLHDYVWSLRLAALNGESFSDHLNSRVEKAGDFLFQIQDEVSGSVPLYGANDGALILPLNDCGYADFRPVINDAQVLRRGTRAYEPGLWDEDLLWLFGRGALTAPVDSKPRIDLKSELSGYYTLRSRDALLFTRAPVYQHRPSHADALHVDLWWRGQNIAVDGGTFSYNAEPPWNDAFSKTATHNTVTVDGLDQMKKAGKFLWLPWIRSGVRYSRSSDKLAYLEGHHDGYERLEHPVSYRRGIIRLADFGWVVLDSLRSGSVHSFDLQWLLSDVRNTWDPDSATLALATPAGSYHVRAGAVAGKTMPSLVRGDPATPRGWRSRLYGKREPALSLALRSDSASTDFWTVFSADAFTTTIAADAIEVTSERWSARIRLLSAGDRPLVTSIDISADEVCRLDILP